jgi:flagellin
LANQSSADTAIGTISNALDILNTARANLGASQNRLEFSAANLNVTIENSESARSSLLDLDIAAEMTNFTSKQILLQAGVSMLAQANQMPQNLLQLLQ